MKPIVAGSLVAGGVAAIALLAAAAGATPQTPAPPGAAQFDADGRLLFPSDYRDWVFLSSGLNMSYTAGPAQDGMDMFGNTFVPRFAYDAFVKTGVWPDKTIIVIENRGGATKGSINQRGRFQTVQTMGMEAHVKDQARFKGGWGFFGFGDDKPAQQIPYAAACYSCHEAHAAVDTTFVQFYPTLLPIAQKLRVLSPSYLKDEAGSK
jgi:hypothetical protein